MKAKKSSKRLHWSLRLLLWFNVLNSLLLIGAYLNTHISPNTVPYISFLGLAFPILLWIELICIIPWLFVRYKFSLLSIVTLLLGWSHVGHFYAVTLYQDDLEDPLLIMSFNVHVFDMYNLENRIDNRNGIFNFLDHQNADILCFQEFYHQENSRDFVTKDSMVQLLETPHVHEGYKHELLNQRFFGLATFSKLPIVNRGEVVFENDNSNACIYSDVVRGEDTVRVFNAHLGSIRLQNDDYEFFGDEEETHYQKRNKAGRRIIGRLKLAFEKRAIQAELVAKEVRESPYPVVLCGDLNDTPVSYCYRQFNSILDDAFVRSGNGIGQTYIGKVPSNRIDYIFHSEELRSANFKTYEVDLSDHKPISCEVEL